VHVLNLKTHAPTLRVLSWWSP